MQEIRSHLVEGDAKPTSTGVQTLRSLGYFVTQKLSSVCPVRAGNDIAYNLREFMGILILQDEVEVDRVELRFNNLMDRDPLREVLNYYETSGEFPKVEEDADDADLDEDDPFLLPDDDASSAQGFTTPSLTNSASDGPSDSLDPSTAETSFQQTPSVTSANVSSVNDAIADPTTVNEFFGIAPQTAPARFSQPIPIKQKPRTQRQKKDLQRANQQLRADKPKPVSRNYVELFESLLLPIPTSLAEVKSLRAELDYDAVELLNVR